MISKISTIIATLFTLAMLVMAVVTGQALGVIVTASLVNVGMFVFIWYDWFKAKPKP